MIPRPVLFALAVLSVLPLARPALAGPELPLRPPTDVTVSTGATNLRGLESVQLDWEFHFPLEVLPPFLRRIEKFRALGDPVPIAGMMATAEGALYGYAGLRTELLLGRSFVFSPSFAAGIYYASDGFRLGGAVEFRSGLELSYQLPRGARLGVAIYHLSNGDLYGSNPGTEALLLTYHARLH